MSLDNHLKMSQLSKETNIEKTTIQHYSNKGLLPNAVKTSPNMKYYPILTIKYLQIIQYLKSSLNYSLDDISELFSQINLTFENFTLDLKNILYVLIDDLNIRKKYGITEIVTIKKTDIIESMEKYLSVDIESSFVDLLYKEEIFLESESLNLNDLELIKLSFEIYKVSNSIDIIKEYIVNAQELSIKEKEISDNLYSKIGEFEPVLILELLLNIKPYVFNKNTFRTFTN